MELDFRKYLKQVDFYLKLVEVVDIFPTFKKM